VCHTHTRVGSIGTTYLATTRHRRKKGGQGPRPNSSSASLYVFSRPLVSVSTVSAVASLSVCACRLSVCACRLPVCACLLSVSFCVSFVCPAECVCVCANSRTVPRCRLLRAGPGVWRVASGWGVSCVSFACECRECECRVWVSRVRCPLLRVACAAHVVTWHCSRTSNAFALSCVIWCCSPCVMWCCSLICNVV
jgi:hypothetical protein